MAEQQQTQSEGPLHGEGGKTVVLAIDGSEHSTYAFQWYKDNVHKENDHIVLVHAVELNEVLHQQQWYTTPYAIDKDILFKILDDEKKKITKRLEGYAHLLTDSKLSGTVKSVHSASPGEGICKVAKDVNASLIITGTRGMGAIRRTLMGSCSDYILHHAHVPVIVCKK